MKRILTGMLCGFGLWSMQAGAQDFEVGLRDHSVAVDYATVLQSQKINTPNKLDIVMMYNKPKDDLAEEKESVVASIGFQVKSEPDNTRDMDLSIGGRLIGSSMASVRSGAFALGGEFSYFPSAFRQIGVLTEMFYAPSILAFRHAEKYVWLSVQVDYFLMDNAGIFIGYRDISMDRMADDGQGGEELLKNLSLDQGVFMGLKLRL